MFQAARMELLWLLMSCPRIRLQSLWLRKMLTNRWKMEKISSRIKRSRKLLLFLKLWITPKISRKIQRQDLLLMQNPLRTKLTWLRRPLPLRVRSMCQRLSNHPKMRISPQQMILLLKTRILPLLSTLQTMPSPLWMEVMQSQWLLCLLSQRRRLQLWPLNKLTQYQELQILKVCGQVSLKYLQLLLLLNNLAIRILEKFGMLPKFSKLFPKRSYWPKNKNSRRLNLKPSKKCFLRNPLN